MVFPAFSIDVEKRRRNSEIPPIPKFFQQNTTNLLFSLNNNRQWKQQPFLTAVNIFGYKNIKS